MNMPDLVLRNFVALGQAGTHTQKGLQSLAVEGAKFVDVWEVCTCAITGRKALTRRVVLENPGHSRIDANIPFSCSLPYACGRQDLSHAARWLEHLA